MLSFFEALLEDKNAFHFNGEDGYFFYQFGLENEYELTFEPLYGGHFALALYYKRQLMWPDKIPVDHGYTIPEGPDHDQKARRQIIREHLQSVLAALDKADIEAIRKGHETH